MPQARMVLTDGEAFALLPPELVAAPVVTSLSFSGSGRYVLAERTGLKITPEMIRAAQAGREPPAGEVSLVLWDSRERVAREIWKAPLNGTYIEALAWLPQTDVALVLVGRKQGTEDRQILLRVSGGSEQAVAIPLLDPRGESGFRLRVSPALPIALLEETTLVSRVRVRPDGTNAQVVEPHETFTLLDRGGRPGRSLTLPDEARFFSLEWDEDGNPLLGLRQDGIEKKATPSLVNRWYALDPQTAALRPVSKAPSFYPPKPIRVDDRASVAPIRVKLANSAARDGETSQSVGLLWLETVGKSEKPRALVCGDSTGGQLLPGGEGVLYCSQGAVWVAPLLRMTREEYQTNIAQARRAVAMSNGKQVGLALLLYAQDHDDTLPGADEMRSRLIPYLKDGDLVEGFVFTYLGGKLNQVQNPVETEVGYVSAPGGRCVLYADGHVEWKKE